MKNARIINHLEKIMVLSTLYNCRSIQQASSLLGISQPSLSVKLKHIEEILECRLFDRSKRGLKFTAAGLRVLKLVNEIESSVNHYFDLSAIESQSAHIRIGIYDTLAKTLWLRFINKFHKKYKNVNFEISTARSSKILKEVLQNNCDIGILVNPIKTKFLDETIIYHDSFKLYSTKKYLNEKIKSKEEINLILFEDAFNSEKYLVEKILRKSSFNNIINYRVSNFELAIEYAVNDIGATLLPQRLIHDLKLQKILVPFQHKKLDHTNEAISNHRISMISLKENITKPLIENIKSDLLNLI